jgi:hypothetical protein
VIKILAVIAGLVLIVFPVWWLEKTAVQMPAYRKGGFADYAYLVYSLLVVYGSVLFGIAVQIVRAKRAMQPLHPFGLFKAGLGGVLAFVIAFFTIDAVYGLTRFGAVEKGFGNLWGLVAIFWTVFGALVSKFSTALIDRRLDSSEGLAHHLDAHRRIAAVGQPRSQGRVTRPDFEPKVHRFGEPTGTAIDGSRTAMAGPMLVINGGSKTV